MGTIHRCHIDLRGEFLVVADACSDFGGRGWMSKLVVEEATASWRRPTRSWRMRPRPTESLRIYPSRLTVLLCFNIQRRHGRSAKRGHVAAICTNTVLSWGVLTD
jgi:hypothetical protein